MKTIGFSRCIFLSWYCELGTCTFCFRSTTKHKIRHAETAKRTVESVLCEAIVGKQLGLHHEFLTGGYGIFEFDEIVKIAGYVSEIYGEKLWVNLGVLGKKQMEKLMPYVEGVYASCETVNEQVQKDVCPGKPILPYSKMLKNALDIGMKTAMTIVIGLGETKDDFEALATFIKEHKLTRITFYALKPVKGTPFIESPSEEYYAWWIKETKQTFPDLKVIAGLTPKNPGYVKFILEAGVDEITKFPAIKKFNSDGSKLIEKQIQDAGFSYDFSLTKLPDVDWDEEVDKLSYPEKDALKKKLKQYVDKMKLSA